MARVIFWGSAERQFEALPPAVQDAFEWAIDRIAHDPTVLPQTSSKLIIESERLAGSLRLRRIKDKRDPPDPGFRGIYVVEGGVIVFLRFVFRDRATYKGLRALAQRARSEANLD